MTVIFQIVNIIQTQTAKQNSQSSTSKLDMRNQILDNKQTREQSIQNGQLEVLLQTNTILIENKRMIYQTKIRTYAKQIDKITKLLETKIKKQLATDQEQDDQNDDQYDKEESEDGSEEQRQKVNLKKKLCQIELKRNQAVQKLEMINKIQNDIKITQAQKQENKNTQNVNFYNTQKIVSQKVEKQRCKSVHTKKQEILIVSQNKQNKDPYKRQQPRKSLMETNKKDSQKKFLSSKLSQQKEWRIKQKLEKLIHEQQHGRPSLANTIYQELDKSDQKDILKKRKRRHTQQQIVVNKFTISQEKLSNNANKLNNGKYLLSKDGDCENDQQLLLWTSRQNDCKEFLNNNSQSAVPQKMINISQVCKNRNERKDPTPSPVSIANSRSKLHENNKSEIIIKNYSSQIDPIVQNQYKILLEETQSITNIINSSDTFEKPNSIKISQFNNKSVFKQIYDQLVKIKVYLQQQHEIKKQQLIQKQKYAHFKQKQKQMTKKILKLQEQQNRTSKQLIKIQQECEIYCTKMEEKQNKYKIISKQIQEIDNYKIQIQNNMDDLIKVYQSNLREVYDELNSIYQSIKASTTQRDNSTNTDRRKNKEEQQKNISRHKFSKDQLNINTKILQMYDYIRNFTQTQKMTVLEYKQNLLSLQYQISTLKNQEKRFQISLKECSNIIEKMDATVKQREKQANKISKEKQKLNKQVLQLRTQVQQYQNLVAIRKNCYNQLETKYNSLKPKKTKIQKNISVMEAEFSEKQSKLDKIEANIQRRQRHLQQINQQVRNILKNKEDLIKNIEQIDSQLTEKTRQIKQIQITIQKREQNLKKLDKKLLQFEQKIQKNKQNQSKHQQRLQYINDQIKKASQDLNQKQWNLSNLQNQVKGIERNLKQATQSFQKLSTQMEEKEKTVKMLKQSESKIEIKIKEYLQQIQKLQQAKQQLQQTLVEILQKKQESVKYITLKYQQLQNFEQQIERLSYQIEEKQLMRTNLITQTNQLNQTYKALQTQCNNYRKQQESTKTKLNYLLEQIEFNRDQQQNLFERISKLKQIQAKLLIEIGIKAYNPSSKQDQSNKQLSSLLSPEMKQQIESIMQELAEATVMKQKYNKQKQQNRKLRLDNERLKKIYQMQMNIDDSIS